MSVYPSKRTLIERIGNLLRAITGDFQTFFTHHPLTYAKLGIRIERVMTDNGSCYRSTTFRAVCRRLGIRQIFTKPYTPRTNGKAERFIQTALREWAYARAYQNSDQRSAELPHWLHRYNWHRPHDSLKASTPISRLGLSEDNLLRLHS
jgi:transposase InsO family protein